MNMLRNNEHEILELPPVDKNPSFRGAGSTAPALAAAVVGSDDTESVELARRLMAEEAMASYESAFELLQQSTNELSSEDFAALQAVLRDDEAARQQNDGARYEDDAGELSYETMLELGERIGDVKTERWTMQAGRYIAQLSTRTFVPPSATIATTASADDSELKCLVCQQEYETGEQLRQLPCRHCFHLDCVDVWLQTKDVCPYCRVSIVKEL